MSKADVDDVGLLLQRVLQRHIYREQGGVSALVKDPQNHQRHVVRRAVGDDPRHMGAVPRHVADITAAVLKVPAGCADGPSGKIVVFHVAAGVNDGHGSGGGAVEGGVLLQPLHTHVRRAPASGFL